MGISRNAELTITLTAKQVGRLECVLQAVKFLESETYDNIVSEMYQVLRQAEREQLGTNGI